MWAISRQLYATQWDGTNAAEVVAMCNTITQYSGNVWSIESDNGQVLWLREQGAGLPGFWMIRKDQVVVVAPDFGILDRMPLAAFQGRYRIVSETFEAALAASPTVADVRAAIAGSMYGGFGLAGLPTLLPGATSSPIAVTIEPAQPNTGYVARAFAISGAAVLTSLQVMTLTKVNGSSCTVVVKNNGVASVGGILMIHVTAPVSGAQAAK